MTQTIIKVPAVGGGAFDPTDITITDDTSGAFLIKEGSNEYMRIDTTNGSEQYRISVPTASNHSITGRYVSPSSQYLQLRGGAYMQVYMNQNGGTYETQVQGTLVKDVLVSPGFVGKKQILASTGSVVIQEIDTDTNFTHTLDPSNSAVYKVEDNAGTPNDYLKLDSTSGSELTNLKAGGTQGIAISGNSRTDLMTGTTTSASDIRIINSGGTQIAQIRGDTNFTYTLNASNNATFKVQDSLASPTQFLTIDSNTASESIKLALTPANADRFFEMTPNKIHARCQNSQINMGTQGITFTAYDDYAFGQFGTGKKLLFKDSSSAEERFSVDKESNATFTLDDGSAATFTITDNASPTPALHLRCTESAASNPQVEVNGLKVFPGKQLTLTSVTYGTTFTGSINQARLSVSLGATSTTRNVNIGAVSMDNFAQILTATPSTTGQTFTLDFNNTSTALSGLPIGLYKLVLKNAGTQSCTFTAASTMAGGGRVKGVDISGASIGVIDSSSGSITAAAGETIYVEVTNHVSDSAGGNANRFIICKTICKI